MALSMTRSILANVAFGGLAPSDGTAAPLVRKVSVKVRSRSVQECWSEPHVFYRHDACPPDHPYDDAHGGPLGCWQTYYATRWSGYSWR